MSRLRSFAVEAGSPAAPASVFAVLADGAHWAAWAGPLVPRSRWARTGKPHPGGIGAVRVLGRPPLATREEIVEHVHDRRLAWTVRGGGLPVRDYRVAVDLVPTATGGTAAVWTGTFRPAVPGTGRLTEAALRRVLVGLARRLATAAPAGEPVASVRPGSAT
jgi:uncharacterized protein YndB with AHSA1/START domain